jgi:hypothetical protein
MIGIPASGRFAGDAEQGAVAADHAAGVAVLEEAARQPAVAGEFQLLRPALPGDLQQFVGQFGGARFLRVVDEGQFAERRHGGWPLITRRNADFGTPI